jgi:thioredoxin reductase (NADPH)
MYDLIIIGMGISGISAAIYAKRNNLNVLILEKSAPGGLLNKINTVDNYPGFSSISGPDLSYNLFEQVNKNNIEYKIEEALSIDLDDNIKVITTNKNVYKSKYVIIATGRVPRRLGLSNEEKLIGHGISNCALCDGNLYKGKDIAVVGGGNSALEETLYLSKIVNKIYLIHRKDKFSAEKSLVEEVKNLANVEIILNANIKEILEDNAKISAIMLDNDRILKVEALFEYVGYIPGNNFLKNLEITNDQGYIKVNNNFETKIPGIYAVGDSIDKDYYQLVLAANDGVQAAIDIISKIKN